MTPERSPRKLQKHMSEEFEVSVRQVDEVTTANGGANAVEVMRRLILAGIGALALTRDEAENLIKRMVERGEIAQKDGERLMREMVERVRQTPQMPQVPQVNLAEQVESGFEQFLNRLNLPSKRDIDELSVKIAQLAARVEELRQVQDQPTSRRAGKGKTSNEETTEKTDG